MNPFDQPKAPDSRSRRWLLVTLLILPLALVIATWAWFHRNLPLPSPVLGTLHHWNWKSGWKLDGILSWRHHQIEKNFEQRTRAIELSGTRWYDAETGATIEFSDELVFHWVDRPSPSALSRSNSRSDPLIEDWLEGASCKLLHSTSFLITWHSDSVSIGGGKGNLIVDREGAFEAGIGFDGWTLGLWARGPESTIPTSAPGDPFGPNFGRELFLYFKEQPE